MIPVLLYSGSELVKGQRFNAWRPVGSAVQAARLYQRRSPDELMFLDIAATKEGRGPDVELVEEICGDFDIPITAGGGIRTMEDVKALLRAGADKVCIGSSTDLIQEASKAFGCQAIVASVDYKGGKTYRGNGQSCTNISPLEHADLAVRLGAGEILLNSIDRDGTMRGYDVEMIRLVSGNIKVPVIACGGCSGYRDMGDALDAGASACAVGALFQFTEHTPKGAAKYLKERGFCIRTN